MKRRTLIGWALGLIGAWTAGVFWVVPSLIRAAYAGRSLPLLNRLISGQATHPVDDYLAFWYGTAGKSTLAVVVMALTVLAIRKYGHRIVQRLATWLPGWLGVAAPRVGARRLLEVAFGTGLFFGLAEYVIVEVRRSLLSLPTEGYSADAFWMTPLAVATCYVAFVLPLAIAAWRRSGAGVLLPVILILGTIGTWGVLRYAVSSLGAHVHSLALLLLGAGASYRAAIAVKARPSAFLGRLRKATVVVAGSLAVIAVGHHFARSALERWRIANLPQAAAASNVLLLILDTVRAPSLSLYGAERPTTPNLEAIAKSSLVFDYAIAAAPWTLPSHAAMFSGRVYRPETWQSPIEWKGPTLAAVLQENGFATAGFVGNLYYGIPYYRLNEGFLHYEAYPRDVRMVVESSALSRALRNWMERRLRKPHHRHYEKRAADINRSFLKWVRGQRRPYFAFMNYIDAHEPYRPPEPYQHLYMREDGVAALRPWGHTYTEEEVQDLRDAYDGALHYVDDQVQRLLAELDRMGQLDNTLVIIASDHGEEFLEHGVAGHSNSVYMPALHVPLLIRFPGRVPAGVRNSQPVTLADIPATIMHLLGLEHASPFLGESLVREAGVEEEAAAILYSDLGSKGERTPPDWYPISRGDLRSVVYGRWHYIQGGGREELYDFIADPWERTDLARLPANRRLLAFLRAQMDIAAHDVIMPEGHSITSASTKPESTSR